MEKNILQELISYYKNKGYAPTQREIAKATQLSTSTVHRRLQTLQKKGYIEIIPETSRGIKIVAGTGFIGNIWRKILRLIRPLD